MSLNDQIKESMDRISKSIGIQLPDCASHIDNSKLSQFKKCPRRYFLEHFLGWRAEQENHNLIFGRLVHEGMEQLLLHGYNDTGKLAAMNIFMDGWIKAYQDLPPDAVEAFAPKIPENFARMLTKYCNEYQRDKFKLIATELGGTVDISLDGTHLYFRSDAIIEDEKKQIASLEWKTTRYSFNQTWIDQWILSSQVLTYQHALNCYAGGTNKVKGIIVTGMCFRNPPRLKLNGEPYAGSKDQEIIRVPICRSKGALENWRRQTYVWMEQLANNYHNVSSTDNILEGFPQNDQACTLYGTCPFMQTVCMARFNPIKDPTRVPIGMKADYWNPTDGLREENKVSL